MTLFPLDAYLARSRIPAWLGEALQMMILVLPPAIWLVADGGLRRGTYGMRQRGLRFSRTSGETLALSRCVIRISTGLLLLPALPLSIIIMVIDEDCRSLADFLCGTKVVQSTE